MIQKPIRGIQLNRTHPLAKGLVGCWLFNEATGETVFDLSGNGNNATLENGVAWDDGGLEFDGVDDYVDCGNDASLQITGNLSIAAWIKGGDKSEFKHIVSKDDVTNRNIQLASRVTTGLARFVIFRSGTPYVIEGTSDVVDENWHYIVGVNDGTDLHIYVDGVLEKTDIGEGGAIDNDPVNLQIGARSDGDLFFNGSIDSVRIYNRALSAEEVTWSYREPYAMFKPAFNPALLYSAVPPVGAIWYYNMLRRRNR